MTKVIITANLNKKSLPERKALNHQQNFLIFYKVGKLLVQLYQVQTLVEILLDLNQILF